MRYTKQAYTIEQQLSTLKSRGLIFSDEKRAGEVLGRIGYFRLAGYWKLFEADKINHTFKPNSHFEDIIKLYEFDSQLKVLVFAAIQRLEVACRAKMAYHFSLKFGPFWFMDEALFVRQSIYEKNLASLRDEVNRSYEDFIEEHFNKYDDPDIPPAWKTLEVASFGTLSKLFSNFADAESKKKVADDFDIPAYKFLRSWLKNLTVIRNDCAHHSRLWNQRFPLSPMMARRMPKPWITELPRVTNSIYPNLCCIAYWLNSVEPNNTFVTDVKALLAKYPNVDPAAMGFPRNWRNEPLWQ